MCLLVSTPPQIQASRFLADWQRAPGKAAGLAKLRRPREPNRRLAAQPQANVPPSAHGLHLRFLMLSIANSDDSAQRVKTHPHSTNHPVVTEHLPGTTRPAGNRQQDRLAAAAEISQTPPAQASACRSALASRFPRAGFGPRRHNGFGSHGRNGFGSQSTVLLYWLHITEGFCSILRSGCGHIFCRALASLSDTPGFDFWRGWVPSSARKQRPRQRCRYEHAAHARARISCQGRPSTPAPSRSRFFPRGGFGSRASSAWKQPPRPRLRYEHAAQASACIRARPAPQRRRPAGLDFSARWVRSARAQWVRFARAQWVRFAVDGSPLLDSSYGEPWLNSAQRLWPHFLTRFGFTF